MKVFTTKYALTTGIEVHEVDQFLAGDKYVYTTDRYPQQFVMDGNAFRTYEEAAVAACKMRHSKEISLRRQLNRVSDLIFPTTMPDNLKNSL